MSEHGIPDLSTLIHRLETEGGSREVDALLWWTCDRVAAERCYWSAATGRPRPFPDDAPMPRSGFGHTAILLRAPVVTTSIDAAVAFAERVLPTFTIDLTVYRTNGGEFRPKSVARLFRPYGKITEHRAESASPAAAICAATLRALEAAKWLAAERRADAAEAQLATLRAEKEAVEKEMDESQTNWIGRMSAIREAACVGAKPMLNEVAEAIGTKLSDATIRADAAERLLGEEVALLDFLASQTGLELSWGELDDPSECVWRVHRRNGGRNDREWTLIAIGDTPREAINSALTKLQAAQAGGKTDG